MRLAAPAVLLLALSAGGCGFHPLYGMPGGNGTMQETLAAIYVEPAPDRVGYELRNAVIDLLDARGQDAGAAYRLSLTPSEKSDAVGVQSQTVGNVTQTAITRYNNTLTVRYELSDARTGKVLTSGVETGLSAYNVQDSPYATLISEQDAEKNAAGDIADRIRIDLAVFFAEHAKADAR